MFRILLGLMFLVIVSNASVINFEEEKYIEALDNSLIKKGSLEFLDGSIKLKYHNSKRILIYKDDRLSIQINDEIQVIDLKNQMALKMVFLLIESIHTNEYDILEEYFTINTEKEITYLSPKKKLKPYLLSVEFKKNKILNYITIRMSNGNITTIREIND